MADSQPDQTPDVGKSQESATNSNLDPKNLQDLTQYVSGQQETEETTVQTLLQRMQDKFQTMSDQIISRIDEMGSRIDELEKNIADLMTQAGVEEGEK